MSRATVTISIDLELAWGNWDNLTQHHIDHVERLERPIVARLVELLDRYELPVTWAFVAALLDPNSARGRPGGEHLWYAPDVLDCVRSAKVRHDIGSHGGRHVYLDSISETEADEDLDFARSIHDQHGFDFQSFVFPRNQVGRTRLLERHGLGVYRGTDRAWHQSIRNRHVALGRAANLVDKMLPIRPQAVQPERDGDLVNLPGSLLFLGRDGIRRFASPGVMRRKLRAGVEAAKQGGGVFHLWFHPSNFWHDTDVQFRTFAAFAEAVAESAARGETDVRPMAAFA